MYTFKIKQILPGDLIRLCFKEAGKLTFMNDDDNQTLLIVFEKNDERNNMEIKDERINNEANS